MSDKARGSVSGIILILLLIVAVVAAALGFLGLQKEKEHSAQLTQDIAQLEVKKRSAEQEARNFKDQIGDLKRQIEQQEAKIQESNSKITSLGDELSVEKKVREDTLLEAKKLKEEVVALNNAKAALESDLKASNERISVLKGKLDLFESSLQKRKAEQAARGAGAPPAVQLDKIVVSAAEAAPKEAPAKAAVEVKAVQPAPPAPLEGKVLAVNEEYDFIVISLGKKDNIAIGDAVQILRQDKKIAEAKIEEVRDTMSVAMPVAQGMIKNIKEEDRALVS